MELIKINTQNGNSTTNATDLYKFLEPKTVFANWIKRMLAYGFTEGADYTILHNVCLPNLNKQKDKRGGHNAVEYVLTLDCAKAIAMVQRTAKGKEVRKYFLEVERKFKAITAPQNILELQNRVSHLETKQIDYPNDWTIDRFLNVNKLQSTLTPAHRQQLGKLCTKEYKAQYANAPKRVPHPTYPNGQNVYPYSIINEVFTQFKAV